MTELYPFFMVLLAGLFFSEVFRRFHFPWVIALILGGMVIGPHGLNLFEPNGTIEFLGEVGLVFLMFMAGIETKLSSFNENQQKIATVALFNGFIPFIVGLLIGLAFGFDIIASLLLGTIFISSSIAVIVPTLQSTGLINSKLGKTIIATTIIEDITSLVFLSIVLQSYVSTSSLPLPLFFGLLVVVLSFLRFVLPKIRWFFSTHIMGPQDMFQQELRSIFLIMIGTVVVFELLGLHSIIAGFFAGLVLSGSMTSELMKEKLRAISYGLFIPIFFILVGTKTDLSVFTSAGKVMVLIITLVLGSVVSKFASGWLGGRLSGHSSLKSSLIGAATIPQLSTTLAVTFTGFELGILSQDLITAMVILSVLTTFASPMLMRYYYKKIKVNLAKTSVRPKAMGS